MNNHGNNYRDNRRKRENRGEFSGRIPKKSRGSRERSNSSDDQREEEGAVLEEVDPVIEARKALEMFEEVSGEAVVHSLPITKKEMGSSRRYERNNLHKNNTNGSAASRMIEQKRSYNNNGKRNQHDASKKEIVKQDPALEKRRAEEENAKERKKIEEEKARRRKRKEDGEARRKKFRPTIAGLQDSNCLL